MYFIKKEKPTQVFACEFCKIFIRTFFIEHLRRLLLGEMVLKTSAAVHLELFHVTFLNKRGVQSISLMKNCEKNILFER